MDGKYLVVGLGNVGREYEGTRHNVGFEVADKVAEDLNINFSISGKMFSEVASVKGAILAKPQNLMNLSGLAVAKLKEYYKIDIPEIIVVSDDFNLELGKVRIRFDGNSGGHKGIESVMEQVGGNFWRVRVGIGETGAQRAEKYVLERFKKGEREIIAKAVDKTAQYLVDLISCGELKNESLNVGLRDS